MKQFNFDVNDATNLSFALQQATYVEAQVLKRKYPAITYMRDIPVDTSANPFAASITFFSLDNIGTAKLISGRGDDIPLANIALDKWENTVRMGAIGYSFSVEAIGQALMAGVNLQSEGASSAMMAYQKFMQAAAFLGTGMPAGTTGLYNASGITTLAATGLWSALTADQILTDLNALISGAWSGSSGVEMADTVRVPLAVYANLASKRIGVDSSNTVLEFVKRANVYTSSTGLPLDILGDYNLTVRAVAYTKDPDVLKLHVPMPLQFMPVQPRNLEYYVPGMFRLAGLDIRRPGAVRYQDGIN